MIMKIKTSSQPLEYRFMILDNMKNFTEQIFFHDLFAFVIGIKSSL